VLQSVANNEVYFYLTVHNSVTIKMPVKQGITVISIVKLTVTKIVDIVREVFIRVEA
jgi:hypothetical protein